MQRHHPCQHLHAFQHCPGQLHRRHHHPAGGEKAAASDSTAGINSATVLRTEQLHSVSHQHVAAGSSPCAPLMGSWSLLRPAALAQVKADERTGNFREQSANLNQYTQVRPPGGGCGRAPAAGGCSWAHLKDCRTAHLHDACPPTCLPSPPVCVQANGIPSELKESMQEHLRLHFDTQDASDEQVRASLLAHAAMQAGPQAMASNAGQKLHPAAVFCSNSRESSIPALPPT